MPTPIPHDFDALVDVLGRTPKHQWHDLRTRLLAECPASVNGDQLFDRASEQVMYDANCVHTRDALREALRQLALHATYAARRLDELIQMGDTEYEGLAAADLRAQLNDLRRQSVAADAMHEQILRNYEPAGADGGAQ